MSSHSPNLTFTLTDELKKKIHSLFPEYSLLAPGPVNLHPKVRQLLSEPMIHHRTPAFDQIFADVKKRLQMIFQTQNEVFILSSTGSGGMECLLVNTLQPGETVLALVSGKFGERWADMASEFGAKVIRYNIPWGEAADPAVVKDLLKKHPETSLVLSQACETSTAVLHPIATLGEICRQHDCLFLVDGITAVGAVPMPMDICHIDGLVAGSQKAFMLPTGLSFVSFSDRAWKKITGNTTPKYYFDIRKEKKANEKGETFFSASVSLIKALQWVLQDIEQLTFNQHLKIISSRAEATQTFYRGLNLNLYSQSPSPSLTAVQVPDGVDSQKIRGQLEEEFQITIMGGQDQLKGKILRIGHMGFVQPQEMEKLFVASAALMAASAGSSFSISVDFAFAHAASCAKMILPV